MGTVVRLTFAAWLLTAAAPTLAAAGLNTGRNVLVVVNGASPDSVRIGEYYAKKRGIPADQILRLTELGPDPTDGIDRPVFERAISTPIAAWLNRCDRIAFVPKART